MLNIYEILSNKTRIEILKCIMNESKNVSGIVCNYQITQSAISQHLAILKEAGFVICEKKGREMHYKIANRKIIKLIKIVEEIEFEIVNRNKTNLIA